MQASTEISTPASADSTLTSDSHETSLPAVLGMADSATTDEPATATHGKDDSSNDDLTPTAASSELPPSAEEDLADDELVFHAPSTVPSAPVSSSVPSLRSRSRQQVLSRGRDPVAPEQPRRNAPRKLDGFSSTNSNNNNIHSVEGESNEGNAVPSLEASTRLPGISLEQNLFQEVQQSIAAAEPVRTFVGRPLRPVVAPLSPAGVESSAVHQSSRSRSRASTPAPTPVELPPSPPPRRPAPSRPVQDEEGAVVVAAPGGGEYEYEYYYDYLDDSPHSTDYDLVPLSAKVTTTNRTYFTSTCIYIIGIV
jgi:hypothetical protein